MALPDPEEARSWGGRTIIDRTGATIGACVQVYTDDATGLPEWATARMGSVSVLLPLVDAVDDDGKVRVSVTRDEALLAPAVPGDHHLSPDDEERLYRHYGIAYSQDGSPTVLPVGEGRQPSADGARGQAGAPVRERIPGVAVVAGGLLGVLGLAALLALAGRRRRRRGTVTGGS
jgi:hypothetical protein